MLSVNARSPTWKRAAGAANCTEFALKYYYHERSTKESVVTMIIKEYRVIMPLSVEEYQVAQLYMVAKLSTQQTGAFVSLCPRSLELIASLSAASKTSFRRRRRSHCFDK